MSIDLRDHLDSSFGDGPAHRHMDDRLVAGRRALRRRRTTTVTGAAAVAAVLALSPSAVAHLHGAPEPVQATEAGGVDLPVAPAGRTHPGTLPLLFVHGTLYRRDASVTVERLLRPVGHQQRSAAAVVTSDGVTTWVYVEPDPAAGHLSAPADRGTLAAWAREQQRAAATAPTSIAPGHTYASAPIPREDAPVRWSGDHLTARPGTTITQRIADPAYSSKAVPASCTVRAVAAAADGTDYFVLGYTCPDGTWDLFTETAGARADTLSGWLDAVKAAQDGGEGVR